MASTIKQQARTLAVKVHLVFDLILIERVVHNTELTIVVSVARPQEAGS
jgi:hypothetical protein